MSLSVERYVTLGDAWHRVFIMAGLRRGSQNPKGRFGFYLEWNLLGTIEERGKMPRIPLWHLVICCSLHHGPHFLFFSTIS